MKTLLVEKYRPQELKDYVFQSKELERAVGKWVSEKQFPNIILAGAPGSGKSSLARVLISTFNIDTSDTKVINGSLTTGVGFIREELEPWMKKTSFGGVKVVLIEEGERLSLQAQDSLKQVIEDYSDDVRFIITTNNISKINAAIQSRLQTFVVDQINMDGILDLVCNIVEQEDIQVLDEADLMSHIEAFAPDLRKIINSIDKHTDETGLLYALQNASTSSTLDEWEKAWADKSSVSLDVLLPLTAGVDGNNFEAYYEAVYNNVTNHDTPDVVTILCSQYLDRAMRSANQRLHLDAFLYHIFSYDE